MRKLFKEHYNRRKLKNNYCESIISQHYNYKLVIHFIDSTSQLSKICSVNRLAKRNIASCSRVVRAVANFFLKTDRHQDFCYPTTFKPSLRFH